MNKKQSTRIIEVLFYFVSLMEIIGVYLQNGLLQTIFKPLIILTLMLLYYFSVEKKNYWYLLALAFSFLGDVFLLDKNNMFLYGIASFLMTQIIYIYLIVKRMGKPILIYKFLYSLLFLNYLLYLLKVLKPNLGDFFYPVLIYGITITVFGLVATLNYATQRRRVSLILMFGALLFIASDTMIALNKFHEPRRFYPVAIMFTYILAQFLIFKWMIKNWIPSDKKG